MGCHTRRRRRPQIVASRAIRVDAGHGRRGLPWGGGGVGWGVGWNGGGWVGGFEGMGLRCVGVGCGLVAV